jgi:hypothetical protein
VLLLLGGLTKRNTPVLKVRGARSAERRKALKVGTKVVRSAARSPPEATARLRPTESRGHGTNLLNRGLVVLCPGRLSPTDRDSRERFRGSGIGVELLIEMAERGERHDGKVPPNRLSRSCSIMTLGYLTPFCPSLVPSRRPGLNALVAALPVATFAPRHVQSYLPPPWRRIAVRDPRPFLADCLVGHSRPTNGRSPQGLKGEISRERNRGGLPSPTNGREEDRSAGWSRATTPEQPREPDSLFWQPLPGFPPQHCRGFPAAPPSFHPPRPGEPRRSRAPAL